MGMDAKDILAVSDNAYHPRDRGSSHGKRHLVVTADVKIGRAVRQQGDALCKPARKFWSLETSGTTERSTCCKCREFARRHKMFIPNEPAAIAE